MQWCHSKGYQTSPLTVVVIGRWRPSLSLLLVHRYRLPSRRTTLKPCSSWTSNTAHACASMFVYVCVWKHVYIPREVRDAYKCIWRRGHLGVVALFLERGLTPSLSAKAWSSPRQSSSFTACIHSMPAPSLSTCVQLGLADLNIVRCESLNAMPAFVQTLADIVHTHLHGTGAPTQYVAQLCAAACDSVRTPGTYVAVCSCVRAASEEFVRRARTHHFTCRRTHSLSRTRILIHIRTRSLSHTYIHTHTHTPTHTHTHRQYWTRCAKCENPSCGTSRDYFASQISRCSQPSSISTKS